MARANGAAVSAATLEPLPTQRVAFDDHRLHPTGFDIADECGVFDLVLRLLTLAELVEHRHQHEADNDPYGDVFTDVVQSGLLNVP